MWARRALARILADEPEYKTFRQALGLIEANRVNGDLDLPDLRLKAHLLASRPEPIFRKHGLELFETIPAEKLTISERLTVAGLYYLNDRWRECRDKMQDMLAEHPQDANLNATFAQMLLERKEMVQARGRVEKLLKIAPGHETAIRLAATLAYESGNRQKTIDHVESLLPEELEPADAGKVLAAAHIYEGLESYNSAEKKYRQIVAMDENKRLYLAAYLGRRGHIEEAFKICAGTLSRSTVAEICALGVAAVTAPSHRATDEQKQQVFEWITFAIKEFPNRYQLYSMQATLLDSMGKTEQAVKLLASIPTEGLSDEQVGLIANNLAYLKLRAGQMDDQALADINRAFDLLGPQVALLDTRAMIHLRRGDCDNALRDLEEAILFTVDAPFYYFHLALAHKCNEDQSAAREAMQVAERKGFTERDVEAAERATYDELIRWLTY